MQESKVVIAAFHKTLAWVKASREDGRLQADHEAREQSERKQHEADEPQR